MKNDFEEVPLSAASMTSSKTHLSPYLRFGCLSPRMMWESFTDCYVKVCITFKLNLKGYFKKNLINDWPWGAKWFCDRKAWLGMLGNFVDITFIATQWLMGWVLFQKWRSDLGIDKTVNIWRFSLQLFYCSKQGMWWKFYFGLNLIIVKVNK